MGDVEGDGSKRLVIASQSRNHFVPLIPCWNRSRGNALHLPNPSGSSGCSSTSRAPASTEIVNFNNKPSADIQNSFEDVAAQQNVTKEDKAKPHKA
eukprot:6744969-Karenia_brevis.AAC.1